MAGLKRLKWVWCCRDLLYQEKENLFKDLSRGTSEVRDLLEKEKEDIR